MLPEMWLRLVGWRRAFVATQSFFLQAQLVVALEDDKQILHLRLSVAKLVMQRLGRGYAKNLWAF